MESEKNVEMYLCKKVQTIGGKALKWSSPGQRSVPDRICLFPRGVVRLVECKREGGTPTRAQEVYFARLAVLGYPVAIVDSRAAVDAWVKEIEDAVTM